VDGVFLRIREPRLLKDRFAFADNKRVVVDSVIRLENSVADRPWSRLISSKMEPGRLFRQFLNSV
jgi:hypothetical protein